MEHFYMGYSPQDSMKLYRSCHNNDKDMEDHLQDFVYKMLEDPNKLYNAWKKWKKENVT